MNIIDLVNKIAIEEEWAYGTYERWVNDGLLDHFPDDHFFGFFCIIDNTPVGNKSQ